ncbi:MAG: hypothetical protein EXS64_16775 [Candidatus Latescibacteria bacterium]|nr:hypothetical protein [Candidatus Latescibacterota bacterium]
MNPINPEAQRTQRKDPMGASENRERSDEPFSARYLDALIAGVEGARGDLPKITRAGEAVAERLVAGGDLFIASVRPDFVSEGIVRSGGLMMLKAYKPDTVLSQRDTVVAGWSNTTPDQDLALLRPLREQGAFVAGIGPAPPEGIAGAFLAQVDVFLESASPLPAAVTGRFGGEAYPLVSLQNLALLWAFTGEMVAALTRRGYMPAMYQSVLVPGARERNARHRQHPFHEAHEVPPLPAGQLGRAYLEGIGGHLRALREGEVPAIERVARACAEVRARGNQIHAFLIPHFPVYQAGAPGDPKVMRCLEVLSGETPPVAELEERMRPGDLFFFLGYYRRPATVYEAVRRTGGLIVEVIAGTDTEPDGPTPDYVIRPRWPYGDSLTPVPNYDVRILPSSGIIQAALYWAVVGAMSKGVSFSVG